MKKILILLIFTLAIAVDYETEIQPIFNSNCGGCHTSNSQGGLNLLNYENLMSSGTVVPGSALQSSLYDRITRPNSAAGDMPPGNAELTVEEIELIELWINLGALEEEELSCDTISGDVNGDSVLNVLDVVSLAQFVLGGASIDFECAADFNGDTTINVLDIVQIVNAILG